MSGLSVPRKKPEGHKDYVGDVMAAERELLHMVRSYEKFGFGHRDREVPLRQALDGRLRELRDNGSPLDMEGYFGYTSRSRLMDISRLYEVGIEDIRETRQSFPPLYYASAPPTYENVNLFPSLPPKGAAQVEAEWKESTAKAQQMLDRLIESNLRIAKSLAHGNGGSNNAALPSLQRKGPAMEA